MSDPLHDEQSPESRAALERQLQEAIEARMRLIDSWPDKRFDELSRKISTIRAVLRRRDD